MNRFYVYAALLLCLIPVTTSALSVSTADLVIPTYGSASHLDQYNEWLGASPSLIDGIGYTPFLPGQTATLTVQSNVGLFWGSGDYEYLSVWVDWNRNGAFNNDEEVLNLDEYWFGHGLNSYDFMIDVPNTFVPGTTWMRTRFSFGQDLRATDALMGGAAYYGEVEDQLVSTVTPIPEPSSALLLSLGSCCPHSV